MAQALKDEIQIEDDVSEENGHEVSGEEDVDEEQYERIICIGVDGSPQAELAFRCRFQQKQINVMILFCDLRHFLGCTDGVNVVKT